MIAAKGESMGNFFSTWENVRERRKRGEKAHMMAVGRARKGTWDKCSTSTSTSTAKEKKCNGEDHR
jgi:hypothetical protein